MTSWHLGTMGFGFDDWRGVFYPPNLPNKNYLRYYSRIFDSVELDTTFYGIPTEVQIVRWVQSTPDNFIFSLKTPRQITHQARLVNTQALWENFLNRISLFRNRLGVVLIQLPPDFSWEFCNDLECFVENSDPNFRYAVEFRHPSWYRVETVELLSKFNVCWAATEYLDLPSSISLTSDFLYIRWIGQHGRYEIKDHERVDLSDRLTLWYARIQQNIEGVSQVFGYFNNDYAGFSPGTCNRFKQIVGLETRKFSHPQQATLF